MKFDIENKILIPFMTLSILPIIILGVVSYVNGYQLLFNDKVKNMESSLKEQIAYIEMLDDEVRSSKISLAEGKSEAEKHFKKLNKENFIILDGNHYVVNNSSLTTPNLEKISSSGSSHIFDKDNLLLIFDRYDPWNWTLVLGIDKSIFMDELLDIQKYTFLMAIIFLVFSMQSIIFIAHNISKPIKNFAEICKRIELNNLKEKISINRSDEIGVLAKSFNNMIDQLDSSAENLIEMKQYNDDILKNISIGIMTTDQDGLLLTINEAGTRIFEKYQNDNLISYELSKQLDNTIESRKSINRVIPVYSNLNSKTIYLDVSTSLLKKDDEHIKGAICSFNDITERKTLENNIVRVNRLASVGEFAAGLAHEIRNPLTGIKTGIQVIKSRFTAENQRSSIDLADGITYEIDRINNLVTELLDFSKPQKSRHEWANVPDILNKTIELTKESMSRKNIVLNYSIRSEQSTTFVDKAQAEQIFINIISNAIDAMDDKGQLTIKIENADIEGLSYVLISFEDNGSGINEDVSEKIFDPFFTTKPKGIGLGLSVVSKLIEENRGRIEIESIKGVSTKFKVYLPVDLGEGYDYENPDS